MASSSPYPLRYSRRSSLSMSGNNQDEDNHTQQRSKKTSNNSSVLGVKRGGIVRRRSAPNTQRPKSNRLQTQTTTATPEPMRKNYSNEATVMYDDEKDQEDSLNLSSLSTETENIEITESTTHTNSSVSADNTVKTKASTITKGELINEYFKKVNTGGYYCKLCIGTEFAEKVSINYTFVISRIELAY